MTKQTTPQPVVAKSTFRGKLANIQAADGGGAPAEIELLQTGEWDTPWHGKFTITPDNLKEYVQHFNDGVRKGVPIDLEHNSVGGAVGWVEGLEIRDNDLGGQSLWATMSWTPAGEQMIKDREYRFFSPEFADVEYQDPETGEYMDNVLIGGGLTNRPLFKNLTAIAANDNNGNSKKSLTATSQSNTIYLKQGNDTIMNLAELLAKAPADLTDEEKAFVVEHKEELTDEQVTTLTEAGVLEADGGDGDGNDDDDQDGNGDGAGDDDGNDDDAGDDDGAGAGDGNGAGTQANEGKGTVAIKASDLKKLQRDAARGVEASEQLARKASEEHVASMCFSDTRGADQGKLPIAAKDEIVDFYHGLNKKQRVAFDAIVGKMPSLKMFSQASQSGATVVAGSATEQVQSKAKALMASDEGKGLTLGAAVRKVLASDKTLAGQYNEERQAQRETK